MNLQHERIEDYCQSLKLDGLAHHYQALAAQAVERDWSMLDYLEAALSAERDARQLRSRQTLVRMAGFPAIKTLDEYDYDFAVGAPRGRCDPGPAGAQRLQDQSERRVHAKAPGQVDGHHRFRVTMQTPASLRSVGWQLCSGPGGRLQMEWVAGFSGLRSVRTVTLIAAANSA